MKHQVVVVGEGVIDRFLHGNEARDVIGGSPLNTAVALRRAGVDATWANRVSGDAEGRAIAEYALANGVAGELTLARPEPTSVVRIEVDGRGVPAYAFQLAGAVDWQWTAPELSLLFAAAPVWQLGSLTAVLEPGSTNLLATVRQAKASQTPPLISYDPNARPRAAESATAADAMRARVLEFVALSDLVKVSDEDLEWLVPGAPPSATAARWSTNGPALVVMTRGAAGAAAFANGVKIADVPGVPTELVDTVGAGDTFMAWLLRGVVQEYAGVIPTEQTAVRNLLSTAARAAAITCSRAGCNPPALMEVLD